MPIHRLLENSAFEPDHIEAMAAAFDDLCRELELVQPNDPLREVVARQVIEFARRGERDPAKLKSQVMAAIKASEARVNNIPYAAGESLPLDWFASSSAVAAML